MNMKAAEQRTTERQDIQQKIGLSSFALKMIAILTMTIDHMGFILFPQALWMRGIGRLAFPVFCFTLTEGFSHTHDLKRYIQRMLIVGLLSEIPFNLAESGQICSIEHQNVFFTLLIGLIMLRYCEKVSGNAMKAEVVIVAMFAAEFLRTDYGALGVLLIAIFWFTREYKWYQAVLVGGWNFLFGIPIQYAGIFAILPIALYNGKKGRSTGYFFYLYYPVHLLILYGISQMIVIGR